MRDRETANCLLSTNSRMGNRRELANVHIHVYTRARMVQRNSVQKLDSSGYRCDTSAMSFVCRWWFKYSPVCHAHPCAFSLDLKPRHRLAVACRSFGRLTGGGRPPSFKVQVPPCNPNSAEVSARQSQPFLAPCFLQRSVLWMVSSLV